MLKDKTKTVSQQQVSIDLSAKPDDGPKKPEIWQCDKCKFTGSKKEVEDHIRQDRYMTIDQKHLVKD